MYMRYLFLIPKRLLGNHNQHDKKISQDMARVLERLKIPTTPIIMIRRHGAEEFHGSNMEESDKADFWFGTLQRIVEEVRCPPDQ